MHTILVNMNEIYAQKKKNIYKNNINIIIRAVDNKRSP